jgi:iron complex transport system permease protein
VTASAVTVETIIAARRRRVRTRSLVSVGLGIVLVVVFALSLMVGNTFYGLGDVVRVVLGHDVPGASFTVGDLRLPRAVLGVLAGFAFGIAGVTFQTMLRNPLASPDVIGISSGASAAAVIGIVVLDLGDSEVSLLALAGALLTALGMYVLASRGGFAGGRLVLIGIGFAAVLQSVVAYVLSRAAEWDVQAAMQWLSGSLNGATWARIGPLAVVCAIFATTLLVLGRDLAVLRLGDDSSAALGLRVHRTRLLLLVAAVVLVAFATASAGPIAFVAFMSGPIAARLVGPGASLVVPAGLVGALLVLAADLVGQNAFDHRYPVGVITGIMGAPYLIALLVLLNRSGGSL